MKTGEMLSTAILIATNAHDGHFDKGDQPYILHPLTVMHKLKTKDEELMCAAVLHDVIEDTDVTYKDLREKGISERVIHIVRGVTKLPGETLEEYKEKVFESIDRMLIKREDLRHNMDPRRLKGNRSKDLDRMLVYTTFYYEIEQRLRNLLAAPDAPDAPI